MATTFSVGDRVQYRTSRVQTAPPWHTIIKAMRPKVGGGGGFVYTLEDAFAVIDDGNLTIDNDTPVYLDDEDVALIGKLLARHERGRTEVERNWKPGLAEWDEEIARLRSIVARSADHGDPR